MAQEPRPRSFQQVLGDIQDGFLSRTGLSGLRRNGPLLDLMEAQAQAGTRSNQDVFAASNASDPTRLRGEQLDRYGRSRGVRRRPAQNATTPVTVGDASFTRIASRLSPLVAPPAPGNSSINVEDASAFTTTGSIYIGRGTASLEGPIAYTSKVDNGSDWTLTLTGTVQRRHDGSEEVVLAQGGDRPISAGATCSTPAGNALASATFVVQAPGTFLPDGEVEVEGVLVRCTQPGEVGNVPRGAISSWDSAPFSGATVTNPLPVSNGRKIQQDPEYLDDIVAAEAARSRGTSRALESFAVGVTAPDEPTVSTSASYVDRLSDEPAVLTIDDGTGYQPTHAGVARERLVGSAIGGEQLAQLARRPVVRATLRTTVQPPWDLRAGGTIAIEVGGVRSEKALRANTAADPYSIASECNADLSLLWECVVTGGGQILGVRSRHEHDDEIECIEPTSGVDAAAVIGIPHRTQLTLYLYLDDQLLRRDGRIATLGSLPFGAWSAIVGDQTLEVEVDGTGPNTYTITAADFAGTGFASVGRNSPTAWATALTRRLPGITATARGARVWLTSNAGRVGSASIRITGGSLVGAGVFAVGDASGITADYLLDRSTGQLELGTPLSAGANLSAGSDQTRGYLEAVVSAVTLPDTATWWLAVDAAAVAKDLSVTAATTFTATVASTGVAGWGARLRLSAAAGTFSLLTAGDYVVFWDASTPASLYGTWYVAQVATDGSYFELDRRQGNSARYHGASCGTSGQILACGGWARPTGAVALRTAEVYDHPTRTWTPTGNMITPRAEHWAVELPTGDVLVGGGSIQGGATGAVSAPERWDRTSGTWTATPTTNAPAAAVGQAAVLVGTTVYVCGGQLADSTYSKGAWAYDTVGNSWTVLTDMAVRRARHTFTAAGTIAWAIGGENVGGVLADTEPFDTVGLTWGVAGNMIVARQGHRSSLVGADIFVTGGSSDTTANPLARLASTEVLVGAVLPWAAGMAMTTARAYHGHVGLSGGKVLVAGGEAGLAQAELYDPAGPSWALAGAPLYRPRQYVVLGAVGTNEAVLAFGWKVIGAVEDPWAAASSEVWAASAWAAADPVHGTSFSLPSGGASFGTTQDRLRRYDVAAGADYTATSLQAAFNAQLDWSASYADRARTTRLRWRTNTWAAVTEVVDEQPPGDSFLAAADPDAQLVGFPIGVRRDSSEGQVAWVLSGNEDSGTPEFEAFAVVGRDEDGAAVSFDDVTNLAKRPRATSWLELLGGPMEGYGLRRGDQARKHRSQFDHRSIDTAVFGAGYYALRELPERGIYPLDRCWFAGSFAIGPYDTLAVVADRDSDHRRFVPNLFRRLQPQLASYSITNDFADADLSPVASLGTSFGINYDFVDHAIYMRARAKTHAADATRSILWRWWRHGAEGEYASVAYLAPNGPDQPVGIVVDDLSLGTTKVGITLAGGALKTGAQIRPSTYLALAAPTVNTTTKQADLVLAVGLPIASGSRTANVTTLTLTLPTGIVDHGIVVNDLIYVASTDPNFSSGVKLVGARTATTVVYAETAPNQAATPAIGTVSKDLGEAKLDTYAPAVVAGDWVRIDSDSQVNNAFEDQTFRVTSSGAQVIYAHASGFLFTATTTLAWFQILDPEYLSVFANPGQTATAIAAAASALYTAGTSPVEPTVLGTGAGTITISSDDEASSYNTVFLLHDGLNAVRSQVAPGMPTTDYSFTFKDAVEPSLAADSDWENEDVRIAPVLAADVAAWLQSNATSGMWPGLRADAAARGRRVQLWSAGQGAAAAIQVAGGSANAWSVPLRGPSYSASSGTMVCGLAQADVLGLVAGGWAELRLGVAAARTAFTATSKLSILTAAGRLTLDSGTSPNLWREPTGATFYQADIGLIFERQGRYIRIQDSGLGTGTLDLLNVSEGDMVLVASAGSPTPGVPQVPATNVGYRRIVRAAYDSGRAGTQCLWVEADGLVETGAVEADVRFFAADSILPGDLVTFGAATWGADNQGTWVVTELGNDGTPFNDQWTINLDAAARSPVPQAGPIVLGIYAPLFRVVPAEPQRFVKRVRCTVPATDGSGIARVRLVGSAGFEIANEAHRTTLTVLDKLEFPTTEAAGRDAYSYYTGLVGEVNEVIVGRPEDPASYPGVECAGADVIVDGPMVRRIYFGVHVSLRQGYAPGDAQAAVRAAVAAAVLDRPHGRPIPVSDLLRAASLVRGVESVAPLSPYSSAEDHIQVAPGERARVLDPDRDVTVTVAGG